MKKLIGIIICINIAVMGMLPTCAYAKDKTSTVEAPTLKSISFNNATIVGDFEASVLQYDLELDDSEATPTLQSYDVSEGADIFVTYILNDAQKQSGINVEVKKDNISANYVFTYINAKQYKINSNNYLESLDCRLGEVYPQINEKDTEYDLYIPSDMTELELNAIPQDVGAVCNVTQSIKLNADQNLSFDVTITASDESTRVYTFQTKRLDKTCKEVERELSKADFTTLVDNELFYQKPEFKVSVTGVLGGLLVILVLVLILKRSATKAEDADELDFFDYEDAQLG